MAMTKSLVAKVALGAINSANMKYETWSKGWWVGDSGVEGLMTANIAETLAIIQENDESLLLELGFADIISDSGVELTDEEIDRLGRRKRADIVLFNSDDAPEYVIEVKRFWNPGSCYDDLNRLRDLILALSPNKGGSLKSGFLATTLAKKSTVNLSAIDKIRQEYHNIRNGIENRFDHKGLKIRCYLGSERKYPQEFREAHSQREWALVAICIEVSST